MQQNNGDIILKEQNHTKFIKPILSVLVKLIKWLLKLVRTLLKKREFWFTLIAYPLAAAVYYTAKYNLYKVPIEKYKEAYFFISLIIFTLIVVTVAHEVIEKRIKHKTQGAKLKIKQEEKWR